MKAKESKIYSEEDFGYMPESQRSMAVMFFNEGHGAVSHSTKNKGGWDMPEPNRETISPLAKAIVS